VNLAPDVLPAVVGGGVVVLAGGLWLIGRGMENRRREALQQYALVRGYRFERERLGGERELENALELFKTGHTRRWGYTLVGRVNSRACTVFEYRYVTGSGNSSNSHRCAVMLWEADSAGEGLPTFTLTPEGLLSRVGQLFGMQDFDFLEDPEFSNAYRLRGPDEAAVRALFTPKRRAMLTAARGQQVMGSGRHLIWWRSGRLPGPDRLDQFLADGDQVRRQFLDA